tara:strand:+ start:1368 stop:1628 length:261 start_codon:yes stop_codon:yes gene_type:complete
VKKNSLIIRRCISCRETFDRKNLFRITKHHNLGIFFNQGNGRSAYICKKEKCYKDPKIQKKLQKALRISINPNFYEIFEMEIQNYN